MRAATETALAWAIRCFGRDHVYDFAVRSLRLAEEAVELAQAYGVPKQKMLDLVEIVYSRPVGDPDNELGGVMLTATVLAAANGFDTNHYLVRELLRVLSKPESQFTERNQQKIDLGLT